MNKSVECCDIRKIADELYPQVKGYLIKATRDPELAEDITQDVMLKLTLAYRRNEIIRNIGAWLYRLARNLVIDYYRKINKEKKIWRIDLSNPDFTFDGFTFSPADDIIRMIRLLPEKYAYPLYKSDIEGLPHKVVAEQLNLGLSAVKMRIQRAHRMLHQMFLECCEIEYNRHKGFVDCTVKANCAPLLNSLKNGFLEVQ